DRPGERCVAHGRRQLAPSRRGRAVLVRHRRDQGIGDDPATADLQGATRCRRRRHADGRNRPGNAIHPIVSRRVDVFDGGHQGRRACAATARSSRPPTRVRCDLPLGGRRARRLVVSRRRLILLVVLGAVALTLSYPPFPLPILSFFAITPAVLLIRQAVTEANPRAAFRWGWWYGLVTNAFVLYWMVVALWHFT